jgi:ribonuclease HI
MAEKKQKYYTVWAGRRPGVYSSWEECQKQTNGFENAIYKSFNSREMAESAFENSSQDYIGNDSFEMQQFKDGKEIGYPIENSICVDGAWNTSTNVIEYQGVLYPSKVKLFHAGPFSAGTNNIAEFLAIVHALTYCKKNNLTTAIYSDSRTAITWVKKKKAATKIEVNSLTTQILSIVNRAENWLHENNFSTDILKWESSAWGENPADFGRK